MPRLRPLLAGMALVLLACLGTGAAAGGGDRPGRRERGAGHGRGGVRGQRRRERGPRGRRRRLGAGRPAGGGRHPPRPGPGGHRRDDPALAGLRALAGGELQLDLVVAAQADPEAAVEAAASLGAAVAALEAPAGQKAAPLRRAVAGHPRLPAVAVLGSGPGVDYQVIRQELGGRARAASADRLGSGDAAVQVTEADLGAGVPGAVAARYLPRLLLANAGLAVRTYVEGRGGDAPGQACSTRPAPPPRPTMPWPDCSPCWTTAAGSSSRATCASG